MVRKLLDFCVDAVRDGVVDGSIREVAQLPTTLRQSILDAVLKNGSIEKPNCVDIFSSVEFLNGMSHINTQYGGKEADEYINRIADAMAEMMPDGKKLGESVSKLSLNIRSTIRTGKFYTNALGMEGIVEEILSRGATRLIGECTNLSSLAVILLAADCEEEEPEEREVSPDYCPISISIGVDDTDATETADEAVEAGTETEVKVHTENRFLRATDFKNNQFESESCSAVVAKIKELKLASQINVGVPIFGMTGLKQLKSLYLFNVWVENDSWRIFLDAVKETLENLNLAHFKVVPMIDNAEKSIDKSDANRSASILPFPMPNLVTLSTSHCPEQMLAHSPVFVDVLAECPKLEYASLEIKSDVIDQNIIQRLAEIDAVCDLKIYFSIDNERVDYERKFSALLSLVEVFGPKIAVLHLASYVWRREYNEFLERAIDECINLQSFVLYRRQVFAVTFDVDTEQMTTVSVGAAEFRSNVGAANRIVAKLFVDAMRASKLREVLLTGEIDDFLLTAIFENCTNLTNLQFSECEQVDDNYLIGWADRNAEKCHLVVEYCKNVSFDMIKFLNKVSSTVRFKKE